MKTIEIFAEAVKFASEASDIPSDRILSESRDADVVDARMLVIQTLYDIGLYPRRIAELLKSASVQIDCTDHDYVYVANMAKADFLGGCLADNSAVAKYVSDVLSDEDQADGFIFNRFYADCARNGVGIPWEDVL